MEGEEPPWPTESLQSPDRVTQQPSPCGMGRKDSGSLSPRGPSLLQCRQAIAEATAGGAQEAAEIQNEAAPGESKAAVKG